MTGHHVGPVAPVVVPVDLGPVRLAAPAEGMRRFSGRHGRMWQWVGDGQPLLNLSVAARTTQLGDATGVSHHLTWELAQAVGRLDGEADHEVERDLLVPVAGARAHRAGRVTGTVHGLDVRTTVVVTTDGALMHVLQLTVDDSDAGRDTERAVLGSIEVRAGQEP
ncbi:hypothetical protein [Nocardioides solisilvae]|uniref:hypothetical protein n=1 Tax=Nocardioides solisilvae TaxID=1542435 RepID=UPI000D747D15|nr:hypothetical protein [Nocardioides solisilvae]